MKILYTFLFFFLPINAFCQQAKQPAQKASEKKLVYKITAKQALQYLLWDSIPIKDFENTTVYKELVEKSDSSEYLPVGNYVLVSAKEEVLKLQLLNQTNLNLAPLNLGKYFNFDIINKAGESVRGADVFLKGKLISQLKNGTYYSIKDKHPEEQLISVFTATDTIFTTVEVSDNYPSISKQKWSNFKRSKVFYYFNYIPFSIKRVVKGQKRRKRKAAIASGFLVMNQPKYKPLDSVLFKGYILDKNKRQYSKSVQVEFSYYEKGKQKTVSLPTIKPISAGAFAGKFILGDSIPADFDGQIALLNKKGKKLISGRVKGEEYLLDGITNYSLKVGADAYYYGDSIVISASAKDANNLHLLDGRAELIITAEKIERIGDSIVLVRDTLYKELKKMETDGDTKFICKTDSFPKASLSLKAHINFLNANNEIQTKEDNFKFYWDNKEIEFKEIKDSLYIQYLVNGKSTKVLATLSFGDYAHSTITLPASIKVNPTADAYDVMLADSSLQASYEFDNYRISPAFGSTQDTLQIQFQNPKKVNIHYKVVFGSETLLVGESNDEEINIRKQISKEKRAYRLLWSYYWAGEQEGNYNQVGLLYKTLDIKVDAKNKVSPGEVDSVKINVRDFKGNPVNNVNLTGLSYNQQFSEQKMPTLPFSGKYRGKKYLRWEKYEYPEIASTSDSYFFYGNEGWMKKLGIDTLLYYRMLLPKKQYSYPEIKSEFLPSFTINVVEKSRPLQMYMLYINNQFVYTNFAKEAAPLYFKTYPGYTKISVRLIDKIITVDSVYLQSSYHTNVVFDVDQLPKNSKIEPTTDYWSYPERNLLESNLIQLDNSAVHSQSYLWQGENVIRLKHNDKHLAGPFVNNQIGFYQPGNFDMNFLFEPGYEYKLSDKVSRLEKKSLFSKDEQKIKLTKGNFGKLNFEDSLIILPKIEYPKPILARKLNVFPQYYNYTYQGKINGKARLQIMRQSLDSVIKYVIVKNIEDESLPMIFSNTSLGNLSPGKYKMNLVTSNFFIYQFSTITLEANSTFALGIPKQGYYKDDDLLDKISDLNKVKDTYQEPVKQTKPVETYFDPYERHSIGGTSIFGTVLDAASRRPIPGVSIMIDKANTGTSSDGKGVFQFNRLKAGKYIFNISAVGYASKSVTVSLSENDYKLLEVLLKFSNSNLEEIVVTAVGLQRQVQELGYSTAKRNSVNIANGLSGKVSGLNIQTVNNGVYSNTGITLRGIRSLTGNNNLILIVDGIKTPMEKLSAISPNNIENVSVLNAQEATAIYGPDGVYGAIVVTTKSKTKTERKTFRDFAYWNPNFFTNKKGEAIMEASYPDNVTGWHSYILAIDKKNRTGQAEFITQAYKPMLAELSVPQFLIQGDVANVIGKSLNYTEDDYNATSYFSINGVEQDGKAFALAKKGSTISLQNVTAISLDTLKLNYRLTTTTGYKDGEERKIPVLRTGIEESKGQFYILKSDTSLNVTTSQDESKLYLHAQNNTLDLLLEEIEHIKDYPYYCMEQTASKLTGYHLQKKIYAKTGKTFTSERDMNKLLSKLQAGQLYSGAWSWWENGSANFSMTNYITNALLPLREQPLVEQNIRNACIYLQNNLSSYKRQDLLSALVTLNKANNYMEFGQWLNKIDFDSLSIFEQWNFVAIKQAQQLDFSTELSKLMKKEVSGMLGSVHWGDEQYSWTNNNVATTLLALSVLKKTSYSKTYSDRILQYFLELRQRGYWRNTVESARITDAIFDLYGSNDFNPNEKATLRISGDTSINISQFPYQLKTTAKNINVQKTGNGIMYFTAYEKIFNTNPAAVSNNFVVTTSFTENNQTKATLKAGEQYNLLVVVNATTDADFVQIDIPIPAACNYANKTTLSQYFPQYAKDKLSLFTEKLTKGRHEFIIPLEARYSGTYNLNPAKVELMYFPTFFGREGMKRVVVE